MARGFIDGEYQDGEVRGINFLVGRRGFGKTTETARLLNACTGGVNFFDPTAKHASVLPGAVLLSDPDKLEEYLRINRGRRYRTIYQARAGNLDDHFRRWCTVVAAIGWNIAAVDEVDKFCGPRWGNKWMPPELAHLVDYGRHCRVSMVVTARRPQVVAAALKAECEWRIFRLKDGKAIDSLADEIGEENLSKIRNLPKFYYLHCVEDEEPILRGGPRRM